MVISVGEILADVLMDVKTGEMQAFVGGAPFNVAVGVHQCGGSVRFYGCVGKDPIGAFLKEKVREKLPKERFIVQTDEERPTTLAIVSLSETGERDFRFIRENSADYRIETGEIEFGERPAVLHIGSLMLSEPEGQGLAFRLMNIADKNDVPISFDVNYREDIFRKGQSAFACYEPVIRRADILKMSEEEIELYLGLPAEEGIAKMPNKLVCVTLGEKGCLVKLDREVIRVPSVPVRPVDTTGAGDAFFGAFLAWIDKFGGLNALTKETAYEIALFANKKGAEATLHKGAVEL